jgi:hypothetical protein
MCAHNEIQEKHYVALLVILSVLLAVFVKETITSFRTYNLYTAVNFVPVELQVQ